MISGTCSLLIKFCSDVGSDKKIQVGLFKNQSVNPLIMCDCVTVTLKGQLQLNKYKRVFKILLFF